MQVKAGGHHSEDRGGKGQADDHFTQPGFVVAIVSGSAFAMVAAFRLLMRVDI
jgi:hypothetical protein